MMEQPVVRRRRSGHTQTEDTGTQPRNWILLVFFCFGPLCMIKALSIYFHICWDVKYQNATAERQVLQSKRIKLEERLQELDNYTSKGWVYFQGSVYLGSTTRSWQESRKYCQKRGADLIIINSDQEQKFVHSLFPNNRWIGLSDLEEEGVWKWLDGSLLNISFWSVGEPNDGIGNEDCAEIMYRDRLSNWNDLSCAEERDFVCEKNIFA
ncbi:CD209 antigen-like protein E [Boleophthalmus pectinirostris]|uniref:CD209 antigen-like protein E n=1 Tax=Boleophthalmus pectinirostris TaxID=150288 RepID=UPI002430BECD|nr:CD209 antigen-like protein E [Boleophthalmus pectinirostris]